MGRLRDRPGFTDYGSKRVPIRSRVTKFVTGVILSLMRSIVLLMLLSLFGSGCADTLETGYVPRKLNATEQDRRAFYAARYSPEATVDKSKSEGPPPTAPRWK